MVLETVVKHSGFDFNRLESSQIRIKWLFSAAKCMFDQHPATMGSICGLSLHIDVIIRASYWCWRVSIGGGWKQLTQMLKGPSALVRDTRGGRIVSFSVTSQEKYYWIWWLTMLRGSKTCKSSLCLNPLLRVLSSVWLVTRSAHNILPHLHLSVSYPPVSVGASSSSVRRVSERKVK